MAATITHTIKTSGGDYTSLTAWEAAQQRNLVSADEIAVASIESSFNEIGNVTLSGWTTDSTRYISITVIPSCRHNGTWDESKYFITGNVDDQAFNSWVGNLYVVGVQCSTGGYERACFYNGPIGSAAYNVFDRCIGLSSRSSGIIQCWYSNGSSGSKTYVINSIGISRSNTANANNAVFYSGGSGNITAYSCIGVGGYNITKTVSSGTITAKNCYGGGSASTVYSGGSLTTCASSDASGNIGLRTVAYSTVNFNSVTSGSENFRLKTGSVLISSGTNTSGESAPLNFTNDIIGQERGSTWSIGPFKYINPTYPLFCFKP